MNWLKSTYRKLADHLTKVLGVIGAGIMSVAAIDPDPIRIAAQTYLGAHAAAKVATALFVLVIFRGWYTGRKVPVVPPA